MKKILFVLIFAALFIFCSCAEDPEKGIVASTQTDDEISSESTEKTDTKVDIPDEKDEDDTDDEERTDIIPVSSEVKASDENSGDGVYVTKEQFEIIKRYAKLEEIRKIIDSNYYTKVSESKLIDGAINGMVNSLGDKNTYYDKNSSASSEDETGIYSGFGVMYTKKDSGFVTVSRVYHNSPAGNEGIKVGDIFLKISGKETDKLSVDECSKLMRGSDGSTVNLEIERDGEIVYAEIASGKVYIDNVICYILGEDTAYLRIVSLGGNADTEAKAYISKLKNAGIKKLVLDLRDNTSGYIDRTVAIADEFLGEGHIAYTLDKEGKEVYIDTASQYWDIPMAVLINERTAGTAEILAGALKARQRAELFGKKTASVGIIQSTYKFEQGDTFNISSAKYFIFDKTDIDKSGITPNVEIKAKNNFTVQFAAPDFTNDKQLVEAFKSIGFEDANAQATEIFLTEEEMKKR